MQKFLEFFYHLECRLVNNVLEISGSYVFQTCSQWFYHTGSQRWPHPAGKVACDWILKRYYQGGTKRIHSSKHAGGKRTISRGTDLLEMVSIVSLPEDSPVELKEVGHGVVSSNADRTPSSLSFRISMKHCWISVTIWRAKCLYWSGLSHGLTVGTQGWVPLIVPLDGLVL